jgi:hypothetical protein
MSGYAYGIDTLSAGTNDANFVVNQGTDLDINVRALSILLNSGSTLTLQGTSVVVPAGTPLAVATLAANSIYLRGISVAAAAPASIDLSNPVLQAAFPSGSIAFFEAGDGVGSSATGYVSVGAGGTLSELHATQGAFLAPVTSVVVSIATTVLSVSYTNKVATTTGYIKLTRVVT